MPLTTALFSNNAKTTLATAILATDTSITVANGALFPNPTPGQYFLATIDTGSSYEIIKVTARNGNVFTNCVRGWENTQAAPFQAGTRIENRITAGTASSWARMVDRLSNVVTSVDGLDTPGNSDSNSYLISTTDYGGNPIVAVINGTLGTWRFLGYPTVQTSGSLTGAGTSTTVTVAGASASLPLPYTGKYVIQFITGLNKGLCRAITSVSGSTITWATALPNVPATNDSFEIYKNESASLTDLSAAADDALIFAIILGN